MHNANKTLNIHVIIKNRSGVPKECNLLKLTEGESPSSKGNLSRCSLSFLGHLLSCSEYFKVIWLCNLLTMNIPGEDYQRNASCALT